MLKRYREYLCSQAQQIRTTVIGRRQRKMVPVLVKTPYKLEKPA